MMRIRWSMGCLDLGANLTYLLQGKRWMRIGWGGGLRLKMGCLMRRLLSGFCTHCLVVNCRIVTDMVISVISDAIGGRDAKTRIVSHEGGQEVEEWVGEMFSCFQRCEWIDDLRHFGDNRRSYASIPRLHNPHTINKVTWAQILKKDVVWTIKPSEELQTHYWIWRRWWKDVLNDERARKPRDFRCTCQNSHILNWTSSSFVAIHVLVVLLWAWMYMGKSWGPIDLRQGL